MTDTANLVLSVDATQVEGAKRSLDSLAQAGANAEAVTKRVTAAAKDQAGTYIQTSGEVTKLLDRYDPLGAKLRSLESDFIALSKAAREGLINPASDGAVDKAYASLQAQIATTKGLMVAAGAAGSEAFGATAIAAEKSAFSTAGARRELIVLGHEAMTGNFSRMPGSFMVLAERVGVTGSLFSAFTVGLVGSAAAAIALAVAYAKGAGEIKNFENSVTLSNSAIGLSASGFRAMQSALADLGSTQGHAATVLTEIASSGRLAGAEIQNIAEAALAMERATGQATDKTIAEFVKLADAPVSASLELNKTFNYLTASVYEQIKALAEHGDKLGAAELAERTLAEAMKSRAATVVDRAGTIEKAWRGVGDAAKSAWDWMLGLGRDMAPAEKLAKGLAEVARIQAQLDNYGKFDQTAGGAATGGYRTGSTQQTLQARLQDAQGVVDALQKAAEAEAKSTEAATAGNLIRQKTLDATVTWDKLKDQMATKDERMNKEIEIARQSGLDAGKAQVDIENMILNIREKYATKAPSTAAFDNAVKSALEYIQALKDTAAAVNMTAEQSQLLAVARRAEKAPTDELTAAILHQGEVTAIAVSSGNIQKLIDAEKLKTQEMGKSKEAIAVLENATRLKTAADLDALALAASQVQGSEDIAAAYTAEAAKLRELIQVTQQNGIAADQLKKAQDFVKEVDTISKQVGQSLSDALMNGGTSAKDFLVRMFKTLVLRPILQPIITGVVGTMLGGEGLAAAQGVTDSGGLLGNAAKGTGGSIGGSLGLLDVGSKLQNAYNLVTGGFEKLGATVSGYASEIGYSASAFGTAAADAGAIAADTATAAEAAATAGASATATAGLALSAATVLGGVGGGIGIGQLLSGGNSLIGGNSLVTVGAGTAIGAAIGTAILPVVGTAIGALIGGAGGGFLNGAFGSGPKTTDDTGVNLSMGANTTVTSYADWSKKGGWFSGGSSGSDIGAVDPAISSYVSAAVAKTQLAGKAYADALGLPAAALATFSQDIKVSLNGLNAADAQKAIDTAIGQWGDVFANAIAPETDAFKKMGETALATLTRLATSLTGVNGVLGTLGLQLKDVSVQGAASASALVDMFGSMANFTQATDYYYQNFYTQQERANKTTAQLTSVFSQLGLVLPKSNDAFRAMVEAAQAAGNDTLFATLLNLAPTFNDLQTSLSQLATTTTGATAAVTSASAAANNAFNVLKNSISTELAAAQADIANQKTAAQTAQTAALASLATLKTGLQAQQTDALASIAAQKTLASTSVSVATSAVSVLSSLFDYLQGQIDSIAGTVQAAQTSANGAATVSSYAAQAASNPGWVPDQTALTAAVAAARATMVDTNYASAFEYQKAQMLLSNDLKTLQTSAAAAKSVQQLQLDAANATVAALDQQANDTSAYYTAQLAAVDQQIADTTAYYASVLAALDNQSAMYAQEYAQAQADAQAQIDAINGVQGGVMSVANALAAFGVATSAAQVGAAAAASSASASGGNTLTDQVTGLYQSLLGRAPDPQGLANWVNSGLSLDQITQGFLNSPEYQNMPSHASGGSYAGGLALVGEQGPELINFNQSGTVYTAAQTQAILGGNDASAAQLAKLRAEQDAQARAQVQMLLRVARVFERWDGDGIPATRTI